MNPFLERTELLNVQPISGAGFGEVVQRACFARPGKHIVFCALDSNYQHETIMLMLCHALDISPRLFLKRLPIVSTENVQKLRIGDERVVPPCSAIGFLHDVPAKLAEIRADEVAYADFGCVAAPCAQATLSPGELENWMRITGCYELYAWSERIVRVTLEDK